MLPPDEAARLVLESVRPLPAVPMAIEAADGLVLAEGVSASCDVPPFENSAMDGYALRAADAAGGLSLSLRPAVMAGAPGGGRLGPGEAARVMTGAPLPEGADAVVPRELAREEAGRLVLDAAPERGQSVRPRGEDVRAGEALLEAGRALGPYEVGVLAGQGRAAVLAVPRPRVALVTSGDELASVREALGPGRVRDSSTPALAAALRRWGCVPVPVGAARDDLAELALLLKTALAAADALFVMGGVSVGDRDLTRAALAGLGAREVFWRTAIKPGKPLLFALAGGKPVWGLPGNPVSSLVTAEVFARPALEAMAGRPARAAAFPERGRLASGFEKPAGLRQFVFCRVRREAGRTVLEPLSQGSGKLSMGIRAQALALLPEGAGAFAAGTEAAFRWL